MSRASSIAVLLVLAVGCGFIAAAGAAARPFAPDSYLNEPLPPDAPLDPASDFMVGELRSRLGEPGGAWVNTTAYSSPVYTVPANQPTVAVIPEDEWFEQLAAQWTAVPLPPDAFPAEGVDQELTVYQPATDTLWEFWGLRKDDAGRWRARYGGRMPSVSTNPGYFIDPPGRQYGATATSIPHLAGLQRISELQAGVIDHAVSFAMPRPAPCHRWPAQRDDGQVGDIAVLAPPEGARLRLPADLDIDALKLPRYTRTVAKAVQKYGMILRDRAGAVLFYAENPRPLEPNPYEGPNGIFGGRSPWELAFAFPWDKLQVLAPAPGTDGCEEPLAG